MAEQNIPRFDISMKNSSAVENSESVRDLMNDPGCLLRAGTIRLIGDQLSEIPPVTVFHDEEGDPFILTGFDHPHDRWVLNCAKYPSFSKKPLSIQEISDRTQMRNLDRDKGSTGGVLREQNFTESTTAELLDDTKSLRQSSGMLLRTTDMRIVKQLQKPQAVIRLFKTIPFAGIEPLNINVGRSLASQPLVAGEKQFVKA